jgi:D-hexose-6-phosphate mutarotase
MVTVVLECGGLPPLCYRPACWPEFGGKPRDREQARGRVKRQQAAALQNRFHPACWPEFGGKLKDREQARGRQSGSKLPHSKRPACWPEFGGKPKDREQARGRQSGGKLPHSKIDSTQLAGRNLAESRKTASKRAEG